MKNSSIRKVAVIEFTDLSGYPSVLGQFIAEELITELFDVSPGQFDVVERRQLAKVLSEQKLAASGLVDPATIANVGKILGIQALVTGSITDLGPDVKINARLIAIDSAKVFAAASAKIAKEGSVERLLNQGTAVDSSTPRENGVAPSRQTQASDVYFQNPFLRIDVRSFALDSGRHKAILSLTFRNLTKQDLLLALASVQHSFCEPTLASDKGFIGAMDASGLPCVDTHADWIVKDKTKYVIFSPGVETTVVFSINTSSTNEQIEGGLFALSMELVRFSEEGHPAFTAGLSNIQARK